MSNFYIPSTRIPVSALQGLCDGVDHIRGQQQPLDEAGLDGAASLWAWTAQSGTVGRRQYPPDEPGWRAERPSCKEKSDRWGRKPPQCRYIAARACDMGRNAFPLLASSHTACFLAPALGALLLPSRGSAWATCRAVQNPSGRCEALGDRATVPHRPRGRGAWIATLAPAGTGRPLLGEHAQGHLSGVHASAGWTCSHNAPDTSKAPPVVTGWQAQSSSAVFVPLALSKCGGRHTGGSRPAWPVEDVLRLEGCRCRRSDRLLLIMAGLPPTLWASAALQAAGGTANRQRDPPLACAGHPQFGLSGKFRHAAQASRQERRGIT